MATPATIQNELAAFKEADDLEGWLYHRITYVDKKPSERLGFLMETQQKAWRSYKSYTERIAWLSMLATQGYYQLQSGDILASISSYENALQFYESYPLPDADVVEYVLKPLGNNYTRLADYNTALFIHQKTLNAALKKGDRNAIASVYSNMAACSRWKGDLKEANNFCKEGISYVEKKKLLYGLLLSTYADVLVEQQRYDTAAVLSRQALQLLQHFGTDMQALYWYTSALQIAARIALLQKEFVKAKAYASTALQLFKKHYPQARQREKAKLMLLLGDIATGGGTYKLALGNYQEALHILLPNNAAAGIDSIYSENTFIDAFAGKAAALEAMGKQEEALENYISCLVAGRKLRAAFFYAESKYRELEVNRSRLNAAMRLAYNLWQTKQDAAYAEVVLLVAELSKAQVLSDERISRKSYTASDTLYQKITRLQEAVNYYQHELVYAADGKNVSMLLRSAEYELALLSKKLNQQPTVNKLLHPGLFLQSLPANVRILEFFEGTDSSYIIEASKAGINSIRCIASSNVIEQFMHEWFESGAGPMLNAPKNFYEASYALYRSIFADYNWKKDQHYILIPDGKFSYLPFDAFVTEPNYRNNYSDWPWLFKKATLSQAWSLHTWYDQQKASYPNGSFTGFFVGNDRLGHQVKLSVEQEYKAIQQLVSGQYFVNADATWQQFNNSADSAAVLHIGSHAMTTTGDSLPYLQLYDKPFYLFDLRYKKFSPALVVLGACKTAGGQLLQGEGLNSLSRGFTAAGAGGVLSGLWNVNDETAIAFMQIFYKQLQQHVPAVALQLAKQQWLNEHRDNPALQLPYYWSGFIYSGHLQPVELRPKKPGWRYIGIGAVVILILVFCVVRYQRREMIR